MKLQNKKAEGYGWENPNLIFYEEKMQREYDFYIVPTPIGNLDDITLRALEVLKSVDIIYCEDTRTTQKLLNHYDIKTKTESYHKFNEKSKADEIISNIKTGKKAALVSDAGTPMICDPGSVLVKELIKNNIKFTSLPGACTIPVFLSEIPRENEVFTFAGFFPKTLQKAKEILSKHSDTALVFYESPNRIIDTLKLIKEVRGDVQVGIGRELTKLFEEIIVDTTESVINHFSQGVKGEIVCIIYPDENSNIDIKTKINLLKNKGFKSKEIANILSTLFDLNKNDIYKMTME